MGWRDVSFQKLPLEIVERKLKHGNEQLIIFARLANISLSLVASFSVLTYYYMQGSAADIIKVAMLNSHSVITNGSNTLDSMDGLTQNF